MKEEIVSSDKQKKLERRARLDALNRNELAKRMERWKFQLPRSNAEEWRATQDFEGKIVGIERRLKCLASDGIVGLFLDVLKEQVFHGHVDHFMWEKPITSMISYYDPIAKRMKTFSVTKDRGCPSRAIGPKAQQIEDEIMSERETKKAAAKPKSKRATLLELL